MFCEALLLLCIDATPDGNFSAESAIFNIQPASSSSSKKDFKTPPSRSKMAHKASTMRIRSDPKTLSGDMPGGDLKTDLELFPERKLYVELVFRCFYKFCSQ